jgi:hypothetical protein
MFATKVYSFSEKFYGLLVCFLESMPCSHDAGCLSIRAKAEGRRVWIVGVGVVPIKRHHSVTITSSDF